MPAFSPVFGSIAPTGDSHNWQWRMERVRYPIDLRSNVEKIENQGNTNSCVGSAASTAVETFLRARGIYVPALSEPFPYRNAKVASSQRPLIDDGTNPFLLLSEMLSKGICTEALFDYHHGVLSTPSEAAFADARTRRLSGFAAIGAEKTSGPPNYATDYDRDPWNDLVIALASRMPVIVCMHIHPSFPPTTPLETHPLSWQAGDPKALGHAVVAVAIITLADGRRAVVFANSYGPYSGDNGYFCMAESQFRVSGAYEMFAITGFAGVAAEVPTEFYRFNDGALEGQAIRLYKSALGRFPAISELTFQANQIHKVGIEQVAAHFLASPEFNARFGNPDNREYVRLLYWNVLGREPDQAGWQFHTADLDSGTPRNVKLLHFSEAPEHKNVVG